MSRAKDWVRMRDRHLSEVLSWANGGITTRDYVEGRVWGWKIEEHFHSGYVEFQVALRYPAGLRDWS